MDNIKLREWISAEITYQLREMKSQLNHEIVEDLKELRSHITADVIAKINSDIDRKVKLSARHATEDIEKKLDKVNNQIVLASDQQAMLAKRETRELVIAVGQQVQNAVYTRVIGEINEKIVPEVNKMVEWVNYNMQDGGEVIDHYRRAVEHQSRKHDPSIKMLTDGKSDGRVISEHVRLFFGDDTD